MTDVDTFLYFAYGSNMSSRRLQHANRAPSAVARGPASVAGYRLVFDKVGRDGSGKADCEHTDIPADRVHGALFQVATADAEALDRAEGASDAQPGYRRAWIVVATADGPVTALTYLAIAKCPGLRPFPWYLRHVLTGAREFDLPADYVAAIDAQPTWPDPDTGRAARELSVYDAPLGRC